MGAVRSLKDRFQRDSRRHCERSEAFHGPKRSIAGLLRFARNGAILLRRLAALAAFLLPLPALAEEPPIIGQGARNLPVIARHGMVVAQEGTGEAHDHRNAPSRQA